jgi:hypothetical protein
MSEDDSQRCMLPPPLPGPVPPQVRPQRVDGLGAATARLVARDAVLAFDLRDRSRFLAALDALLELASDANRRYS